VFVVDDLAGWLIGRLADAGYQKLTTLLRGSDQARALKPAVRAAVQATVAQIGPFGGEEADRVAEQINKAFRRRDPVPLPPGQPTVLEALQVGIVGQLSVLDDAGQPVVSLPGVPVREVAAKLTGHLVREIMISGSGGGPLAPLADQLNHDVTHLQGERLEGMLAQLAAQVTALAQASGGAQGRRKPVRLPPRPVSLAGREELLAEVGTRLRAGDDAGPRLVALCGLGGAGKTSVAVEYAHRQLAEVGVAWQFPAEDATVLAAGFGELAAQLGIRGPADNRESVASVHAVLAGFAAPWLLIFDNAAGMDAVTDFLPPAGSGQVLVTSQNPSWPQGQALRVPLLGTEIAADFLVRRTSDPDRQAAAELAAELGGLPLALEQAAAYTQAAGDTLAGYLALFQHRRAELLDQGQPAGYDKTVASTWALAFDRVQTAAGAVGLLRLLAFLAPEAVPLRLLLQPRPGLAGRLSEELANVLVPLLEDRLAANDAIRALRLYSLVTPADGGSVSVHRLVQAVTADRMPDELGDAWRQAAAAVIEAAIPDDPRQPDTWPVFAALLPHAQAALAADSDGLTRVASYLGLSGSYLAAREFSRGLLEKRVRVLGAADPRTVAARIHLARSTGEAGDAAAARDQSAELLPVTRRVLGPEHPDTLAARANLASFTGQAGDAAGARDQFAALLLDEVRVLGLEHQDTLSGRHDLAYWTGKAGDMPAARDQFAALLPDEVQVLGEDHPDTLITRIHLAWSDQETGQAADAQDQFAALLPIVGRVLGPEHPRTLMTRHDVAWSTGEAGDWAAAREHLAALLRDEVRVLGPEYPLTLAARYDLARCTGEAGDAAGARDQLAVLLPIQGQVLGREHPDTLATRDDLAHWTKRADGDADGDVK